MACELYLNKVVNSREKKKKPSRKTDNKEITDKKDLRQGQLSKPNIWVTAVSERENRTSKGIIF